MYYRNLRGMGEWTNCNGYVGVQRDKTTRKNREPEEGGETTIILRNLHAQKTTKQKTTPLYFAWQPQFYINPARHETGPRSTNQYSATGVF